MPPSIKGQDQEIPRAASRRRSPAGCAGTHVAANKGIPPFLIVHVTEHPDTTAQAQRLAGALKEAGLPVTLFGGKETTHNKINADLGLPNDPGTKALNEFVGEALKK